MTTQASPKERDPAAHVPLTGLEPQTLDDVIALRPGAVRVFVQRFTPLLRSVAGRSSDLIRPGQRDAFPSVEDVTQELLIGLFASDAAALRKYDATKGASLATFLRRWATWRAVAIYRLRHASAEVPVDGEVLQRRLGAGAGDPEQAYGDREVLGALRKYVREVHGESEAEILEKMIFEEESAAKLGRETGQKRGQYDTKKSRARRHLRDWLRDALWPREGGVVRAEQKPRGRK